MTVKQLNHFLVESKFEPDLVLIHGSDCLRLVKKIKKISQKPRYVTLHNSDFLRPQACFRELKKGKVTAVAYRSHGLKNKFYSFNINFKRFPSQFIALSGIEESLICEKSVFFRNIDRTELKIVSVSNLIKRKRIDTLIDGLSISKDVTLDIIGDGPERKKLKEQADNTQKNIRFLGKLSRREILDILQNYDAFFLISENETFGLVYLEAMANGLITVGTKNEGIDGTIIHEYNGFLLSAGNPGDIKELIEKIQNYGSGEISKIKENMYKTIISLTDEKVALNYFEDIRKFTCI